MALGLHREGGRCGKVYILGAEKVTNLIDLLSPRDSGNRATVAISVVGPVLPLSDAVMYPESLPMGCTSNTEIR